MATVVTSPQRPVEFKQVLGLFSATMIVAGSLIGSGIFRVPSVVAGHLVGAGVQAPGLSILTWIVAGVFAILGALTYGELGASMPKAGGQYIFLREAYGSFWAYLFGWTLFLVIITGTLAAVSVVFGEYLGHFIPLNPWQEKAAAIGCIAAVTAINYRGVDWGALVQNLFTVVKIGTLAAIVLLGWSLSQGSTSHFVPLWPTRWDLDTLSLFGLALAGPFFAADAWYYIAFAAEEIKEARRNLPLSMLYGVGLVTLLYVLVNLVYLYAIPLEQMATSKLVAADAVSTFLGRLGGSAVAAAILISCFGCVNGIALAGARAYYAMARDRLFFRKAAELHPVFQTPAFAIVTQGIWASVLTLTGAYDQLFTYVMFVQVFFYAMTAAAVFILRRKFPDWERPYKVWGYPVVPILFIVIALLFVVNTLFTDPRDSLMGLGIVLLGVPVYWFWRRRAPAEARVKA